MNPRDFAIWLNGAMQVIDAETSPSPAQWNLIREKLNEVVGGMAAEKIAEMAKPYPYDPRRSLIGSAIGVAAGANMALDLGMKQAAAHEELEMKKVVQAKIAQMKMDEAARQYATDVPKITC